MESGFVKVSVVFIWYLGFVCLFFTVVQFIFVHNYFWVRVDLRTRGATILVIIGEGVLSSSGVRPVPLRLEGSIVQGLVWFSLFWCLYHRKN